MRRCLATLALSEDNLDDAERRIVVAYVTRAGALAASRSAWTTKAAAESAMRKSAAAPMTSNFDIFLSHSYEDVQIIAGVKSLIEGEGLSVYVDWIEDAQADRSKVTAETADMLRERMGHCRFLLYASSQASGGSKWMPWELGYFDGKRPDHVGILPIVESETSGFVGQEYLGLYPAYQLIDFEAHGVRLGRYTGRDSAGRTEGALLKRAIW